MESFCYKALFRNSPPTQAHIEQVVRGDIGFSFQLAIIQHQLKNFTRLDIATCERIEKLINIKYIKIKYLEYKH